MSDPYAAAAPASGIRFLPRRNPLATLAAVVPAMAALVFVRDLATPLAFLVLALAVVAVGVRIEGRMLLAIALGIPTAIALVTLGFAVWTDPSRISHDVVVLRAGGWTLYGEAVRIGLATGLRLAAIVALALVPGLSTTGADLVRAMVQQLRVPYRIGYTALAAFRFVPRFGHELEVIRQAHRVRGAHAGRGPIAAVARWGGYVVPLLAGAIRHAERVALAMDARAFGAHTDRTERHLVRFRPSDAAFAVGWWLVTAAVLVALPPLGW